MSQDSPTLSAKLLDSLLHVTGGLPEPLPADPMPLIARWFDEAVKAKREPNPNAFVLATVGGSGAPSARVVLCKAIDVRDASLTFFTNYTSRKAAEFSANPRVAGVFHWDFAERQARVEGEVSRLSDAESDAYFATRHPLSRLGAWASEQSRPLPSRAILVDRVLEAMKRFGVSAREVLSGSVSGVIPRPPYWGGLRLSIHALELWQGVSARLHDRARWTRTQNAWTTQRLYP